MTHKRKNIHLLGFIYYIFATENYNYLLTKNIEMVKKILLFIIFTVLSSTVINLKAQNNFSISTDFQSRYIWRGQALGKNIPSIQPALKYNWKGLNVGAWGAFSTSELSSQELDLYVSYTFLKDMFTFIITDYAFPQENSNFKYFDYDKNTTSHVFEGGLVFNGLKNLPLMAYLYVNFYGNDTKNNKGNNVFSTYGEVSYNPICEKINTSFSFFAGFAFNGGYREENNLSPEPIIHIGYYGNEGFAFVNLGMGATKTLKITDSFSLPINTKLIFNPDANKAYFTIGTGITL